MFAFNRFRSPAAVSGSVRSPSQNPHSLDRQRWEPALIYGVVNAQSQNARAGARRCGWLPEVLWAGMFAAAPPAGPQTFGWRHKRGGTPPADPRNHHKASTIAAPNTPIKSAVPVNATFEGSSMNCARASGMLKITTYALPDSATNITRHQV